MTLDEELKKDFFNISVDEEGIMRLTFTKDTEDPEKIARTAELVEEAILKIFKENEQKIYNGLVDISPLEGGGRVSKKSKKVYIRLMSHQQLHKIAILASKKSSLFLKVVTIFASKAALRGKSLKWFNDEAEAMKWLREKNSGG